MDSIFDSLKGEFIWAKYKEFGFYLQEINGTAITKTKIIMTIWEITAIHCEKSVKA